MLLLKPEEAMELFCQSCPYNSKISRIKGPKQYFKTKQVDAILGNKEQWENVDSTDAVCPKCDHNRAYFMQIQIRSADEPSTLFYKCVNCSFDWREN